jgi:two-component system, cell cycle sensor histidine kinase and response regulator CckA
MDRAEFDQWPSRAVASLLSCLETERRYYQEIVAQLPLPVAALAEDNSIVWANRAFRRMVGLSKDEVRRKPAEEVLKASGLGAWLTQAPQATFTAQAAGLSARYTALSISNPQDDADPETLLIVELVSAEMHAPAPAAPAAPIAAVLPTAPTQVPNPDLVPQGLPAIVWTADAESTDFRTVAGAAEEFLGYPVSYWLNRPGFFEERIHPDDREATMAMYRALLAQGGDASAEFRAVTAKGDVFWCRESIRVNVKAGVPGGIVGVLTSIERRKQMEQQLLAAGRMDAVQALAGRLAHDLNNPLMVIKGYGEEMLGALDKKSAAFADTQEIMGAAERIGSVATSLTEVARRPSGVDAEAINVCGILAALRGELGHRLGESVQLNVPISTTPIWALAAPQALREVILALASGALAGTPDGTRERTRVDIECSVETLSERLPVSVLPPGRYVRLVVRDHGLTASPASVFDPNLNAPQGDGLQLTRAYQTVRQWGGSLAYTQTAVGGEFSLYLPGAAAPGMVEEETTSVPTLAPPQSAAATDSAALPEPTRETILVVDDETGIRGLMRKILRRERYNVLEAATAEDALKIAGEFDGQIALLLTDVMLPGIQGPDLARRMHAVDPKLRVLYISGYTPDESVRNGSQPPGARFLAKPFTLGALLGKVRETLGD